MSVIKEARDSSRTRENNGWMLSLALCALLHFLCKILGDGGSKVRWKKTEASHRSHSRSNFLNSTFLLSKMVFSTL